MKNILMRVIILTGMVLGIQTASAQVPVVTLISGVIKKVIIALDLKVQQLQNQTILLQNTETGLENNLHLNSLTDIGQWLGKERKLYEDYYHELAMVKVAISGYDEVRRVIAQQVQLVNEYKSARQLFQQDKHFSANEIKNMLGIYDGILQASIRNLDEVLLAVKSAGTQMTDFERLRMIHRASTDMQKNLNDLREFNNSNVRLSMERAQDEQDRRAVRQLYGIN
ncbi:MAG: conjugal transfer protein TraI [Sphingobacteriales bacterium]